MENKDYNAGYNSGWERGYSYGYKEGKEDARIRKIIDIACDLSVELTELGDEDLKNSIVKGLADGGHFILGDNINEQLLEGEE